MSEFLKLAPNAWPFRFLSSVKEEKQEDLLADLQDISDSERKTSTAESSVGKRILQSSENVRTYMKLVSSLFWTFATKGSASGSEEEEEGEEDEDEEEEEESSSQSEENEEGESGSDSEGSDQSAGQDHSSWMLLIPSWGLLCLLAKQFT